MTPPWISRVDRLTIAPNALGTRLYAGVRNRDLARSFPVSARPPAYRVGSQISYLPSASISAFKFSVAVSNCFLVKRTITGSASLKKPRLSPR